MLSIEQRNDFLSTIKKSTQMLDAFTAENTLQEFERFENQLTLHELEEIFTHETSENFNDQLIKLIKLLSNRWERIRNSSLCYTQKPDNIVNQLCLKIASVILSISIQAKTEIEALKSKGPYCLLMPSLENCEDVYGDNIHRLKLHEFVLSDQERVFIPLVQCLHQASISDQGQLRHMVMIDNKYPELTSNEIERVSKHSKQASEFYQAIVALNIKRLLGDDLGAKFNQLAVALRNGGVHKILGGGKELDAGAPANLGILEFHHYWQGLSKQQQSIIFSETPEMKNIVGRLFYPNHSNYQDGSFCVELLADQLDPVIEVYNKKASIQKLRKIVQNQKHTFITTMENPKNLIIIQRNNSPRHILHLIFKLNSHQQQEIFKSEGYDNALMYALAHEPEALLEFELNEESKRQAILARTKLTHDSGLIVAAKRGKINVIELLLDWGADIESQDINGSNALHWAAYNGHVEVVDYLLGKGALLESRGMLGDTALHFAVLHGKADVVDLLLKKNASINIRNQNGLNPLEIAITDHPELFQRILIKLASYPLKEQAECLFEVFGGPYPSVLFASAHIPTLFDTLIAMISQQFTPLNHAIVNATDKNGLNALIIAAQLGSKESVRKLVDLAIDIESSDINGSTALHWAANNGHVEVVDYLLEKGALLESKGMLGNTALHFAVLHGKADVVELLLKKKARINVRNQKGLNPLDLAIIDHPELVERILIQLASYPLEEQAEILLKVPGGPYPNVFFYAATINANILARILPPVSDSNELEPKTQPIHEQLHHMGLHYLKLKSKSLGNTNYKEAVSAAEIFLKTNIDAIIACHQNNEPSDIKKETFKKIFNQSIETARPILGEHREKGKSWAASFLTVATFPISLPLYAAGFFSLKTKSEQILDQSQKEVGRSNYQL